MPAACCECLSASASPRPCVAAGGRDHARRAAGGRRASRRDCHVSARALIADVDRHHGTEVELPESMPAPVEEAPERPRENRQYDVVDGATETALIAFTAAEVDDDPIEATMRADVDVERRRGRGSSDPRRASRAGSRGLPRARHGGHWMRHRAAERAESRERPVHAPARARPRGARCGDGSGRGIQRGGVRSRRWLVPGVGRMSEPVNSTLPTPSIMQWWTFVTMAKQSPSSPSTTHISQSGFPRSSCWDMIRAARRFSSRASPGFGRWVCRM